MLLPHSGSCRLPPPTPVVLTSILDSSTRDVDPAILLVMYMHAVIRRECRHLEKSDIIHWMMWALPCFRSYQLVLCLLPGVPSSTSTCSISCSIIVNLESTNFIQYSWSNEFPSVGSYPCFSIFRDRYRSKRLHGRAKCERISFGYHYTAKQYSTMVCTQLSRFVIRLLISVGFKRFFVIQAIYLEIDPLLLNYRKRSCTLLLHPCFLQRDRLLLLRQQLRTRFVHSVSRVLVLITQIKLSIQSRTDCISRQVKL